MSIAFLSHFLALALRDDIGDDNNADSVTEHKNDIKRSINRYTKSNIIIFIINIILYN